MADKKLSKTEKDMITNGKSHIRIELKTKKCGRKIFIVEPENKPEKKETRNEP